jgi:bacterioferritin B
MLISKELASAFNEQIGHEFGASMQYLSIAGHFEREKLVLLAKLFYNQAEEEKEHALKFVHYVSDAGGELQIPAIVAPKPAFGSAEEAVQAALSWEQEVTDQINRLMDLATSQNDYLAQNFLAWFVDEQLEEVMKMDRLLNVVRRAGEKNLLMVEAYLVHLEESD